MVNIDSIKEQLLRMEGYAEGLKQGAQILAKWMVQELAQQEKNTAKVSEQTNNEVK